MIDMAIWVVIFLVALFVMLKGTDLFLENAERAGLIVGLPPFVIGVLIVGVGTSLPELTSSLIAVLQGVPEIVAANAVGSNISNILLVGGLLAVIGARIRINRDLLDAELPFFVISTALFVGVVWDRYVDVIEALLLGATYGVYLMYLFTHDSDGDAVISSVEKEIKKERKILRLLSEGSVLLLLLIGLAGLLVGAKYVVDSVLVLANALTIKPELLAITAVALGTSLPELSVSIKALQKDKFEVALGNIFGSNAFNILLAVGIPALIGGLAVNNITFDVGVPILIIASFILLVIGMARRLYRWEGIMFLIFYAFFILKLFGA